MPDVLQIGNAQGFWGDRPDAPYLLASAAPDLDWLTLDYLAEVSMSILAKQRERDPSAGYARDFLDVIASLTPLWRAGRKLRLITNAGGLNPLGCAKACSQILRTSGCAGMKIGIVSGDDVLDLIKRASTENRASANPPAAAFVHLETGAPISSIRNHLVTANAYLGAEPIVQAIRAGAQVIITGRVADPSLAVAPCIAHFNWPADDWNRIAGATVAGHLVECGTQVTGGICTDWLSLPDPANIGYPIAQVASDGSCIITKPPGTGGRVDAHTVTEQLVYEIGDPGQYLSPDATVSFLPVRVEDLGDDRVGVSGAIGSPAPSTYKVSATYRAGYRASGMLTIYGRDAAEKARRCGQIILDRLRCAGTSPERSNIEYLGTGDAVPIDVGGKEQRDNAGEVVLRITVADPRKEIVERFTREIAPLVTTGPQGVTGYAEGRPVVREVFGYWPTLIDRLQVHLKVELMEV